MSENGEIYTAGNKFYTPAGTDGMDKFHLCLKLRVFGHMANILQAHMHCRHIFSIPIFFFMGKIIHFEWSYALFQTTFHVALACKTEKH